MKVTTKEKNVLIEPLEPSADKYFEAFKITRWPKNLDEFVVEVMKQWWTTQVT